MLDAEPCLCILVEFLRNRLELAVSPEERLPKALLFAVAELVGVQKHDHVGVRFLLQKFLSNGPEFIREDIFEIEFGLWEHANGRLHARGQP